MIINITVIDPRDTAACDSLVKWLLGNRHIKENVRLFVQPAEPGLGLDEIELALGSGFDLASLATALTEWRISSRGAAPVVVQVDGMTTALSLDDLDDVKIVHRALSGAPAPQRSSCVLIGVSDYARLRVLPAVRQNLVQLEEVLTDPGIWGIPSERLHTIAYPQSVAAIRDAISAAAQDAPDTLLVYLAGHVLYDKEDGLLLALPEATGKDRRQTVPWRQLAEVIGLAVSRRRIVWLDCCYAGLTPPGKEATPDPPELLEVAKVEGTYLLAATQQYEEAKSQDGEGRTAFTGELVNALRDGIAPGPPAQEFLSLNALHQQVRSALRKKHLPEPGRHDPDHIGQLPHFHNNLARGRASRKLFPEIRKKNASPGELASRSWRVSALVLFFITITLAALTIFGVAESNSTHITGVEIFTDLSGAGTLLSAIAASAVFLMGYLDRRERLKRETRTLNERFTSAAEQLGSDKPAVRIAGVHAMASVADGWEENRQTCIDVLCAYLRLPYEQYPGQDAPETQRIAFQATREVRHTVIRVIAAHLQEHAPVPWRNLNFDFTSTVFDGGNFTGAQFSGGKVRFDGAQFSGGEVRFDGAQFSGGKVSFDGAWFSGGEVRFDGAQFSGGLVSFDGATFSGGLVSFDGATFSGGTVRFGGARFFGGLVRFDGARFFGGLVRFGGGTFSGGAVDFSRVADWSFRPSFSFHRPEILPGVKFPRKEEQPWP